MSIPKVGVIKTALLAALADGRARKMRELVPELATQLALTPDDLALRYATGDLKFENLAWWARLHLKEEGAIHAPERGVVQATAQGLQAAQALSAAAAAAVLPPAAADASGAATPEEALDAAVEQLDARLRADVLERVKAVSPQQFERLVVDLLLAMGYGFDETSGEITRYVGDGGIDGLVREDKLGLSSIFIQAKRYKAQNVGRPEVQQFLGALTGAGASKGVFLTSADFSREAREFVARLQNQKVVLIGGEQLARLMVEHGVGVSTTKTLAIRHVDSDYFDAGWGPV